MIDRIRAGLAVTLPDVASPEPWFMEFAARILRSYDLNVIAD